MTTPIRTNKPIFFGNNGEVLKSGYIYIGQPRQDPRNFPKTVTFKDSAGGLFTAAQPLRTNAQGQISYNGKAIIALVDGDYSLLVQDSNQVQTKDGWTPLVEADESDPNASTVVYRSLLSDLKAVNVTPGQYVENIGKITVQDGEGARWLVISNTGGPGDDVDLIDFDNGTQGVRIENQLYAIGDLTELDDVPAARATLDVYSTSETYSTTQADDKFLDPDSVTLIWNKTPTTVIDMDTDIDGGNPGTGFYVVVPDNGTTHRSLIYIETGANISYGTSQATGNGISANIRQARKNGPDLSYIDLDLSAFTVTLVNILQVYKVK